MIRTITDEQARRLYAVLIDASWQDPKDFEMFQRAWEVCADAFGITDIENNGHGTVRRVGVRQ